MTTNRSLGLKITLTVIMIVVLVLFAVGAVFSISMKDLSGSLIDSNREMGKTSRIESSASMTQMTQDRLMELAENKAGIVDDMFREFQQDVMISASMAERIYAEPEAYGERDVPLPDPANDGKLSIQVLYSASTDPEDEKIRREVLLLGNIQDALLSINQNNESMASNYIATESGIMIQADLISGSKFDENGVLMPLEAKERPWYVGAKTTGEPFLTPTVKDLHTPRLAIMCGVPIYKDGQFMAVSGAGMYLDDLEVLVNSVDLGKKGDACILNQEGRVLFSTYDEGLLAEAQDGVDLRQAEDREFAEMAERAISGEKGVSLVEIDQQLRYVAYAPMKTVGWSFLIFLPQEEVEAPAKALDETLGQMTEEATESASQTINRSTFVMLIVLLVALVLAFVISLILSRRISKPIRKLTEEVSRIGGDDLDFHWDLDTGDETQVLADSFGSLTKRMQSYIEDMQTITAEQERMETELSVATRIQAAMLPSRFPAFPDRKDFDLHASMDPAREVGGDFYDFFLIDEDHLGLVIADVSGKGVPAALFMMASMIMIANNAKMGLSPAEVLDRTNQTICASNREDYFVTVWLGILELSTGKLTASNAGHEYPILKRPGGLFEIVKERHGCAVGAFDDSEYEEYVWQLEPGSRIFVYTDGVPEAMKTGRIQFGLERALEALNKDPEAPPKEILDHVREAVDEFVGEEPQFDDLTMMCVDYKGPARS